VCHIKQQLLLLLLPGRQHVQVLLLLLQLQWGALSSCCAL
jgi:hypothetical protein